MTAYLMEPLGQVGTPTKCPGCGSGHTVWVGASATDSLLCKTCGVCWRTVSGRDERVDVQACPGCQYKAICMAAQG